MSCIFCQIAAGTLPAHKVLDDDETTAFLDHRPLFLGHCLLIPKRHIGTLMELPDSAIAPLFLRAKRLAIAVERALGAEGIFIGNNNRVSQSVPHLHIHIVPRRKKDALRGFFWPRQKPSETELARAAELIRKEYAA